MIKFSVRRGEDGMWVVERSVEGSHPINFALTHHEQDAREIAECLNRKHQGRLGPAKPVEPGLA